MKEVLLPIGIAVAFYAGVWFLGFFFGFLSQVFVSGYNTWKNHV
jgi:hypothetical protein